MTAASAPDQIVPCPHCGAVPPLARMIEARLAVPATLSELAALFGTTTKAVYAAAHKLKQQGRVERLNRTVEVDKSGRASKRGRKSEFLWQRKYP